MVTQALKKREYEADLTELLDWDSRRRNCCKNEAVKAERNKMNKQIPMLKKRGEDTTCLMARLKEMADQVKAMDEEQGDLEEKIRTALLSLPNLPAEDVVAGGKENNQVVSLFGEKPAFPFEPKNHMDLCTDLGLID